MIEFRQVTKRYDSDHTALRQVNFHLNRGELAFLTGHSGAGKSTLLKLIMVMERPSAGEVVVGGQVLNRLPRRQIPYIRRHIGVVFQNHQLLFDRTVFDNVAMPLEVMGASPRDVGRRVRAALDKVGLLRKEKMNPLQLSGGQMQRVAIARALVNRPKIIFADEPTGNLDSHTGATILELFRELSRQGRTIVLVTHDNEIAAQAPRRIVIRDGLIVDPEKHAAAHAEPLTPVAS